MAAAAVHPHGCGEHLASEEELADGSGSSPRVWGTYHEGLTDEEWDRFIPTGVGNIRR